MILGTYVEMKKLEDVNSTKIQEKFFEILESFGVDRSGVEDRGYDTIMFHFKE